MKTNNYLLIVFSVMLFSCDNSSDPIQEPETYRLSDVTYFLQEGDGIKKDTFLLDTRVFNNNSAAQATLTIKNSEYEGKLADVSQFQYQTPFPFTRAKDDTLKISVPTYIVDNALIPGDKIWEYTNSKKILQSDIPEIERTLEITPYTKYDIKIYAIRQTITTHYTATFTEPKSGKSETINGKWEGSTIKQLSTYITIEDIKQ